MLRNDKVDIGETLAKIIRVLHKDQPMDKPLKALSAGSSSEPQFKILESVFYEGLYLMDIEKKALDMIEEQSKRRYIKNIYTICADYNKVFFSSKSSKIFLKKSQQKKINLVTFHHSLYYAKASEWFDILKNIYDEILDVQSVIHAV